MIGIHYFMDIEMGGNVFDSSDDDVRGGGNDEEEKVN